MDESEDLAGYTEMVGTKKALVNSSKSIVSYLIRVP